MADIFVSYASSDLERVTPIVVGLEQAGYTVWWDQALRGGSRFAKEIEAELKAAKVVLAVWTNASLDSRWVTDEAEHALRSDRLIPINLDDVEPPIGFRQIQAIDMVGWRGDASDTSFQSLLKSCAEFRVLKLDKAQDLALTSSTIDTNSSSHLAVAVLPFADMSPGKDQEWFSDGMTEEVLQLLAQVDALQVAGRSSSLYFKEKGASFEEIGELLHVNSVIEGTVRKMEDRIRVTAQLVDIKTGYRIWSDTYDRSFDDTFEVQREIATAIVRALLSEFPNASLELPQDEYKPRPDAYQAFLLANQGVEDQSPQGRDRAVKLYRRAVSLDPDYIAPYVGLVRASIMLDFATPEARRLTAEEEIQQVVRDALAQDLPKDERHYVEAIVAMHDWAFADAEKAYNKTLELNPNHHRARGNLSTLYSITGRLKKALHHAEKLVAVDRLNLMYRRSLLRVHFLLGNGDALTELLEESFDLGLAGAAEWAFLAYFEMNRGNFEEMDHAFEKYLELSGFKRGSAMSEGIAATRAAARGDMSRTRALLDSIGGPNEPEIIVPTSIARMYLQLDCPDEAFAWLEKAVDEKDVTFLDTFAAIPPPGFLDDPRGRAVFRRAGLDLSWYGIEEGSD